MILQRSPAFMMWGFFMRKPVPKVLQAPGNMQLVQCKDHCGFANWKNS